MKLHVKIYIPVELLNLKTLMQLDLFSTLVFVLVSSKFEEWSMYSPFHKTLPKSSLLMHWIYR